MTLLILLLLLSAFTICLLVFFSERERNPLEARLGKLPLSQSDSASAGMPVMDSSEKQIPDWAVPFSAFGEKLAGSQKDRDKQRRLLTQAGWRDDEAVGLFMVIKSGFGVALVILAIVVGGLESFSLVNIALYLGAYFVGGLAPELFLKFRAAKRYNEIMRSMPDALDLMVICAEAGLPFTRIIKVVAKELELSAPALSEELAVTNAELQLLPDRSTALRHLAERTMVPSVETMVATLIQAERYGTPLSQALHNIADESRNTMILTLEELAGKLPARLSIPLMTMILPPVVALVATPALMRVIRSLL